MNDEEFAIEDMRIIKIKIDDSIIKDPNSGFGFDVAGKEVRCRFPSYGKWDEYAFDLSKLFLVLSQVAGDIRINGIEELDKEQFEVWAALTSIAIRYKECRELIEKIFFIYLRPSVVDLEIPEGRESLEYTKEWLGDNMDMSHLFSMFQSILFPEEWFKKKAIATMRVIFPNLIPQSSKVTSPKNSTFQLVPSIVGPAFEFA